MKEAHHLPPEYKKALQKAIEIIHLPIAHRSTISDEILMEDNKQKIVVPFVSKQIPSGSPSWRWNQTKSRKRVILGGDTEIEFFKLTPRKRTWSSELFLPYFKLWRYNVRMKNTSFILLWCENGLQQTHLNLEDYNFLAPFMDDVNLSSQLWPSCEIKSVF